jgi:hypothetical protein
MMIDPFGSWWRPLFGAATVLVLAACTGGGDATLPETTVPETTVPDATTAPVATTTAVELGRDTDASQTLAAALEPFSDGYQSTSYAFVNGAEALTVAARNVAGNSEMVISSGDGVVEYVVLDGVQWARTPGEEWALVAAAPLPPTLHLLAAPGQLGFVSHDGATVVLAAVYAAEPFGLHPGELEVTLEITDGTISSAEYEVVEGAVTARVTTTFSPLADRSEIVAPAPLES